LAGFLSGTETEYGVVLFDGKRMRDGRAAAGDLMDLAMSRLLHLPAKNSRGIFLTNGSRFYIDLGAHPEISTPECLDPLELARFTLAGDRILEDLARTCSRSPSRVIVFKCNVDYSGSGATWGCHENFLHSLDWNLLTRCLLPHLATRIIYTGAGGFNNLSGGIEFLLSPRVAHLHRVVSDDSTDSRGILNDYALPLCRGSNRRLHLICGESLCSQRAVWLRSATTWLILALAQEGIDSTGGLALENPLEAMRAIARDPDCRIPVSLEGGEQLTALQIQRKYLEQVERHLGAAFLPSWAGEACAGWRDILDALEADPRSLRRTLDWSIKLDQFTQFARLRGFTTGAISGWNDVMQRLAKALASEGLQKMPGPRVILSRTGPLKNEVRKLNPFLRERGLSWDGLEPFLRLRRDLFELDVRFGLLHEKGIFRLLEGAGFLRHEVDGMGNIDRAMHEPPASGRAHVRGNLIRKLDPERWRGHWIGIWAIDDSCKLDLSDPFSMEERWADLTDIEDYDFEDEFHS